MTSFSGEVHPAAAAFPMIEGDEFDALSADIAENGLRHCIVVNRDGVLLDGRNRLAACQKAGVDPRFTTYSGDDEVSFVISSNVHRRNLDASRLAMVGLDLLPLAEAEARKRQAHGSTAPGQTLGADVPQASERGPRARDEVAAQLGVSGRQIAKAKRVQQVDPETADKVRAGEMSLNAAEAMLKRQKVLSATQIAEQGAALAAQGLNRAEIADRLGVAECTYRRAKDVAEAAAADPERFGDLLPMMDRNLRGAERELRLRTGRPRAEDLELRPRVSKRAAARLDGLRDQMAGLAGALPAVQPAEGYDPTSLIAELATVRRQISSLIKRLQQQERPLP